MLARGKKKKVKFQFFIPLYRSHKRKPEYRPSPIAANSLLERCKITKRSTSEEVNNFGLKKAENLNWLMY